MSELPLLPVVVLVYLPPLGVPDGARDLQFRLQEKYYRVLVVEFVS